MFQRSIGFEFLLYFIFLGGLSLAGVQMTALLAGAALETLTFKKTVSPKIPRVTTGLEAQARAAVWQPAMPSLVPPSVPDLSAAALAKGMDNAENQQPPSFLASRAVPLGSRVAAWTKRVKLKKPSAVADESSGGIVLRSLRVEM